MSEEKTTVNIGFGLTFFIVILAVTFCGEPDLHDKLIESVGSECEKQCKEK